MGRVLSYPKFQAFDSDGNPLSGGKVHTYNSGTTIPLLTYSDANLTIPNTNPIILDARGEAWMFPTPTGIYTIEVFSSTDVLQWSKDGIGADASAAPIHVLRLDLADTSNVANGDAMIGFKQPYTGAQPSTVHQKLSSIVSVFDFMTPAQIADVQAGTALVDVTAPINSALAAAKLVRFPAGTYKVTSSILVQNGQKIIGEGRTMVTFKSAIGSAIFKNAVYPTAISGVTFEGLTIDNTSSATAGGIGLGLANISGVIISDVEVKNVNVGIKLFGTIGLDISTLYVTSCVTGILTDNKSGSSNIRCNWSSVTACTTGLSIVGDYNDHISFRNGFWGNTTNVSVNAAAYAFKNLHFESIVFSSGTPLSVVAGTGQITWINCYPGLDAVSVNNFTAISLNPNQCGIYQGWGTPEARVAAPKGSIYQRTDGGAGTSFYVKESGTGNTGWVGK